MGRKAHKAIEHAELPTCPFCDSVKLCEHFIGWSFDTMLVAIPYEERVPEWSLVQEGGRVIETTASSIITYRVYGVVSPIQAKEPRSKGVNVKFTNKSKAYDALARRRPKMLVHGEIDVETCECCGEFSWPQADDPDEGEIVSGGDTEYDRLCLHCADCIGD